MNMTGIGRGKHNVLLDISEWLAKGLKLDTGQLVAEERATQLCLGRLDAPRLAPSVRIITGSRD